MFIVYVLKSLRNSKKYIGFTSKSMTERMNWHRWGLTSWTKQNGPFELLYTENLKSKEQALKRELYFKTGQGRKTLDLILSSASAKNRGGSAA